MKNRTPPRPKGHAIPKFTPVPRQRNRHDGWTPERQRAFIEALARTGSVSHAAKEVNMAAEGAYQLRLHPKGESFRKAWEAALDFGVQRLEDIALERAMNGVLEPVFGSDGQIGERRRYNDRLLMFLLRHRLTDRYGDKRYDILTPKREAELRAQWEAERDRPSDGSRVLEAIRQKLLQMKERGAGQEASGHAQGGGEGAIDWEEDEEEKADQPSPDAGHPQEKDEPVKEPRIRSL
jgi:hypothetical protein